MSVELSVVVATYNRPASLLRLLRELSAQTCEHQRFEVVVIDDGSQDDMAAKVAEHRGELGGLNLRVHRQHNGGAARARQKGAELSAGRLLLFVDDDMELPSSFVQAHLDAHRGHEKRVVMGRLRAASGLAEMPLFERFYARMLDRLAEETAARDSTFDAPSLYTGNLSLPRELFFDAGGFDVTFKQIEDAELGVRLERAGASFHFSEAGYTVHASDHVSRDKWLARSITDGRFWARLAQKHPDALHANPWRHLGGVNPLSRPILAGVVLAPFLADPLARTGLSLAELADKVGLEKVALAGTTLVYGIQYFRGVRSETGGLADAMREYRAFREGMAALRRPGGASESLFAAVKADHEALVTSQGKYGGGSHSHSHGVSSRRIVADAVNNIGFQMLIGYRTMRALHLGGHGLGAKFVSRLLRHVYGSDIHWEAEFSPGIVVVHGFGLAIAPGVRVGPGCILFQHVTLGRGLDPESKIAGVPTLEANVHVGVGATVVGPLTVGAKSKIGPGCTVVRSVPSNSVVESPAPTVRSRG